MAYTPSFNKLINISNTFDLNPAPRFHTNYAIIDNLSFGYTGSQGDIVFINHENGLSGEPAFSYDSFNNRSSVINYTGNFISVNDMRIENTNIHLGDGSGEISQGDYSVAIGRNAATNGQGVDSIAIGSLAGNTFQGNNSVAVGYYAGYNSQGINTVAIGNAAGLDSQGIHSVAIGAGAGNSSQGMYSIAIGNKAGELNQSKNSIVINASPTGLQGVEEGLYIRPIRNLVGPKILYFNVLTNEITYYDQLSSTGTQGPQGVQGTNGILGTTGTQGASGLQGTQGASGLQGTQGASGLQGTQGANGNVGATGSIGLQGTQGTVGKGFTIFGTVNNFSELCSLNPTGANQGEFALVLGGQIYIYAGSGAGNTGPTGCANDWIYSGDLTDETVIIGPQGNIGLQGFQGFIGLKGETGSIGLQGSQGSIGIQGYQGTIGIKGETGSIGYQEVQGLDGNVGATGSIGVQGYQGVQGIDGNVGATGTIGLQGTQGTVGKGFTIFGTVNNFSELCSLNPTGANQGEFALVLGGQIYIYAGSGAGNTGPTGCASDWIYGGDLTDETVIIGPQGNIGLQGLQGVQGNIGLQGVQGFQGNIGPTGLQGVQGWQGVTGPAGLVFFTGTNFRDTTTLSYVQNNGTVYYSIKATSTSDLGTIINIPNINVVYLALCYGMNSTGNSGYMYLSTDFTNNPPTTFLWTGALSSIADNVSYTTVTQYTISPGISTVTARGLRLGIINTSGSPSSNYWNIRTVQIGFN